MKPSDNVVTDPAIQSRRFFLKRASLLSTAVMIPALPNVFAANTEEGKDTAKTPNITQPKRRIFTPEDALKEIKMGNERYVSGVARRHDFIHEREALVSAQHPYACVLSCADSRIAPEYAFDSGRGDIFVVRVAGNIVTDYGLASLEFAVAVLQTPLIVVLGHENCGAVSAAIKYVKDGEVFPGKIKNLTSAIAPSVQKVIDRPGNILKLSIEQNINDAVTALTDSSDILTAAVQSGKLKILGGIYRLATGQVEFFV